MNIAGFIEFMNYSETKRMYLEHRKNMINAERDEMNGNIIQQIPIMQKKITPKITQKVTKRTRILFVQGYIKEYKKISATGLARKYENIFRNTKRKPDRQLIKDFTVILNDLVGMRVLKKYGSSRGVPAYIKIIA